MAWGQCLHHASSSLFFFHLYQPHHVAYPLGLVRSTQSDHFSITGIAWQCPKQRVREVIAQRDFPSPPFTEEPVSPADFPSHVIGQDSPRPPVDESLTKGNRATGLGWSSLDPLSGSEHIATQTKSGFYWHRRVWSLKQARSTEGDESIPAQLPSLWLWTFSPAPGVTPLSWPLTLPATCS